MIRGNGHSYFHRSRFRSPRSQRLGRAHFRALQTEPKASDAETDHEDSFRAKLDFFTKNIYKKEPVENAAPASPLFFSEQFFKTEDTDNDDDAYVGDGGDSDDDNEVDDELKDGDDSGSDSSDSDGAVNHVHPGNTDLSSIVPAQYLAARSTSDLPASQPPTTDVFNAKKTTKYMDAKASMTIEELYPGIFLPLTRANILKMNGMKVDSISYPWKKNTLDISQEQLLEMKAVIISESMKQFIAFSTNKGVGWGVKTMFPWMDCSTSLFRVMRYHGQHIIGALKHELLFEKIYSYLFAILEGDPEIANMTGPELLEFLGPRFDKELAKYLWSRYCRIVDFDKTFAEDNPNKLGAWYLRQVFLNLSIKVLPVICSEVKMNPTLRWNKKAPSGWVADKKRREDANWFFDCLCIAPEVKDVELDSFVWIDQPELPPVKLRPRKRLNSVSHGSGHKRREIIFHGTPHWFG